MNDSRDALQPLGPGDPGAVGPFRLSGRWSASVAGSVFAGEDEAGRRVSVVLLGPGPQADAAARDRFDAAVRQLGSRSVVVDGTSSPWPWVALPEGDRGGAVLDAVLPGAAFVAERGPSFSPHWTQTGWSPAEPVDGPAGPEGSGRRGVLWWVLGAVAVTLVLALAAVLTLVAVTGEDDAVVTTSPVPGTTLPAPLPTAPEDPLPDAPPGEGTGPEQTLPPSPEPPGEPTGPPGDGSPEDEGDGPDQPPLATSGPGVVGPSYTPQDQTQEMRLDDLPFAFRLPPTWGCLRSGAVAEPTVRYVCLDDAWLLEGREGLPPGGVVEVRPCPDPCGEAEWDSLRDGYAAQASWRLVDAGTAVVEDVETARPGWYRIRMSRVFASGGDGTPDTHVYVELSGPPEYVEALQKIVNDVRANTP